MARRMLFVLLTMASLLKATTAQSPVPLVRAVQSVRDENGNPLNQDSAGSTLIYGASKHAINRPSGKQLTLADFTSAQGAVSVQCVSSGTRTILRLWSLVPRGIYSVGVVLTGAMGGPPASVGALSDDPKASTFTADQDGNADLVVTKKPGRLSGTGSFPSCLLADQLSMVMQQPVAQIIGYYHFDNTTNGSEGTFVPQFMFVFPRMMRLNNEIVDKQKKPIADTSPPNTRLYEFRKDLPVLAPSTAGEHLLPRHHVTLGEFRKAAGSIAVRCTDSGTHVAMSLNGLIPHGTYTVWVAKPDPNDQTHMKMIGVGALGKDDGSENSFTADENGFAYVTATNPGGKLSTFGTIGGCWLTGEPMVQIAGVYHIDGTTHGPVVGTDGTYVGQFAFAFMAMPPQSPGAKPGH
jgi:hypothetical protein